MLQDFRFRFLIGCLLLPVLLGMAGSVVFLLGMSILLWELLYRKMYWYYIFLILSELIFLFYLSVYLAWQGEYRMILLPDFYYEPAFDYRNDLLFMDCFSCLYRFNRLLEKEKQFIGSERLCSCRLSVTSDFTLLVLDAKPKKAGVAREYEARLLFEN